ARVDGVRAIAIHDRRNDLAAVLQFLHIVDRVRTGVDVDVRVGHAVRGEELLDAFAVRAPRRAVHGDGPLLVSWRCHAGNARSWRHPSSGAASRTQMRRVISTEPTDGPCDDGG